MEAKKEKVREREIREGEDRGDREGLHHYSWGMDTVNCVHFSSAHAVLLCFNRQQKMCSKG